MAGCAPLYVPTVHNVPMLSGKGEFQGSADVGLGINLQTAYAVTNQIVVTANYLYASFDEEDYGIKNHAGEIGLGYYTNFREQWCFEVIAGYGLGKGNSFDSTYNWAMFFSSGYRFEAEGLYNKIYIQPSIGLNRGDFTWSISTKFSYINFTKIDALQDHQQLLMERPTKVFCSLVGNFQAPVWRKRIFLRYQAGLNFPTGNEPQYDYETIIASFGLIVKLKPKLKK